MKLQEYIKQLNESTDQSLNTSGIKLKIINFFKNNPNPTDKDVHSFAEKLGIDEYKFEEIIYSLLGSLFGHGKSVEKEGQFKVDPKELEMGTIVEMEHTNCPIIASKIAMDHLEEISDYYTRLAKMENEAKRQKELNENVILEDEDQMKKAGMTMAKHMGFKSPKDKGFFDKCVKHVSKDMKNPEGYCAKLKDISYGDDEASTYWRGEGKTKGEVKKQMARIRGSK